MRKNLGLVLWGVFLFCVGPAWAGEPRLMAAYDAWEVYLFTEDGHRVCYMASQPGNREGNYTKRGDSFALITHRPADHARDVFSYVAGYPFKSGAPVRLVIDAQEFVLTPHKGTAWAPDSAMDSTISKAIRTGKDMKVLGTSARGTLTTDTFSLQGSGKAYEQISQECR